MIVTCTQCQTRFKVPDAKIPAKGVRVRCSKCNQTFHVTKGAGVPEAGLDPASPDASDPFGLSDPPPAAVPIYRPAPAAAPLRTPSPQPAVPAPSHGAMDFDFGEPMTDAPSAPAPFSPFDDDAVGGSAGLPAGIGDAPDRSLFDMPAPSAAPPASAGGGGLLDEIPDLPGAATPGPVAAPPSAMRASVPLARITAPSMPAVATPPVRLGTRVVRTLMAAALLVLLVGLLGVVLNGGRIPRWEAAWKSSPAGAAETREVVSGLYDTQNGKWLFIVRGEVRNRGARASRLVVVVEPPPGVSPSARTRFAAGGVATPEELATLTSEADASALLQRLDVAARPVSPGASVPFLALFYDVPQDGMDTPVRVRASVDDTAPLAAAPVIPAAVPAAGPVAVPPVTPPTPPAESGTAR